MNDKPDVNKLHKNYENYISQTEELLPETKKETKFPYEFFSSVDRGWIRCDIGQIDTEKELVKVIFYNPDAPGWLETCQGGLFDEVVEMWRVRLKEN